MSLRLLFVVHRYAPFPGGSEYNVQRLAEEALKQGHRVTVLADTNQGDLNGVTVTGNRNVVFEKWDLIFVHGSCTTQDFVHANGYRISSPIYYLLVQPKDQEKDYAIMRQGCKFAKWIGCGTNADWDWTITHGVDGKGRQFHYGIPREFDVATDFKERYGITTPHMYLSVGGFWPHKGFDELAKAFREAAPRDTTLVLMGYDGQYPSPAQGNGVVCISGAAFYDVYGAMDAADLYIMNSSDEGFGLVLLEAMLMKCPWIARPIAAGYDFGDYDRNFKKTPLGLNFTSYEELVIMLKTHDPNPERIQQAHDYVVKHHLIDNSLKDILRVLENDNVF